MVRDSIDDHLIFAVSRFDQGGFDTYLIVEGERMLIYRSLNGVQWRVQAGEYLKTGITAAITRTIQDIFLPFIHFFPISCFKY